MPNLHVLYVQPSELFGGAERQAATLIPRLPAHGLDVTALVGPGTTIVDWLRAAGVDDAVHSTRFPRDWADSRWLLRAWRAAEFAACVAGIQSELDTLLRRRRPDVVVAAMAFSWLAVTAACRRHGVPVVWRVGGTELARWQRGLLARFAHRYPPDLAICNSATVARMFAPLIPARVEVVPNGVDVEVFRPGAGRADGFRPPGAEAVLGFAGRIAPQKRLDDLLRAVPLLRDHRSGVHVLVAGTGHRQVDLQHLARRLGIADRVTFLGYVADMRGFLAACDLLVLPSRSEGCPNIVLEAMAMRVPVVASDTEATREVMSHARDGWLFPTGDVGALASGIDRLLGDREFRAQLATQAHARIHRDFDAGSQARRMADLLRSVAVKDQRTPFRPGAAA